MADRFMDDRHDGSAFQVSSGDGLASIWNRLILLPVHIAAIQLEVIAICAHRMAEALGGPVAVHSLPVLAPPRPVAAPVAYSSGAQPEPAEILPRLLELRVDENQDDLRGDSLKLVRSRVVFVRRGDEYAFPPREELISDDLEPGVFEAWKTAEFIQQLADPERAPDVPVIWLNYIPPSCRHENGKLRRFPPGDLKYLRVYVEVLRRSPRERLHFHERQIKLLREIASALNNRPVTADNGR
jgi:hypothetical protein